jgi:glutathione S-transferase
VEVIGDGICDACVLLFWERHRPEEQQSAPWMARQRRKVDGGLRALATLAEERNGGRDWLVGDRFGLADIVAGTVLGYLDVRFPEHPWRSLHPVLVRLAERFATRPSFRETQPVPQRISDRVV